MSTTAPSPCAPHTARRSGALDGLRGFAAFAVVSGHLTLGMGLLPYHTGGFIGVLVFFVLSGYLIGAICWRAPSTWAAYRSFVTRRVQRLAPVIVALVAVGVPAMVAFGGQTVRQAVHDAALAAAQVTAFAIALGADSHSAWGPTWSLTVEWVFYLLFPLGILALKRYGMGARAARNAAAGMTGILYVGGLFLSPKGFYLLPVANTAVMLAGAALALDHAVVRETPRKVADPARGAFALVLLSFLAVLPVASLSPAYKFAVLPAVALSTVVVINACRWGVGVSSLLSWQPLSALGVRAYSLYIWHMPVFWLVWLNFPTTSKWLRAALALAVLVPVVTLSFRYLERPWLRRHDRRSAPSADPSQDARAAAAIGS